MDTKVGRVWRSVLFAEGGVVFTKPLPLRLLGLLGARNQLERLPGNSRGFKTLVVTNRPPIQTGPFVLADPEEGHFQLFESKHRKDAGSYTIYKFCFACK